MKSLVLIVTLITVSILWYGFEIGRVQAKGVSKPVIIFQEQI